MTSTSLPTVVVICSDQLLLSGHVSYYEHTTVSATNALMLPANMYGTVSHIRESADHGTQ